MSQRDEFVEGWSNIATAEEARDGIERVNGDRPKSKAAAVEVAGRLLDQARSAADVERIVTDLLSEIRADGIKQWARELTRTSLNKDDGIDAIIRAYFSGGDRAAPLDRAPRPTEDRDGSRNPDASKAALYCGKRRTTSKEYYGIGQVGADSSWRSQELNVEGTCRKCHKVSRFQAATGQNLAAATNQILDLIDPRKWLGAATKADFNFYRCSSCSYLQKICAECDEICETTSSQCSGCGHAFG